MYEIGLLLACLLLELLQADDDMLLGSIYPAAFGHQSGTGSLELGIVKDPLWRTLNVDDIAGLDQLCSRGGRQGRPMLEGLGLAAEV